MTAQLNTQDHTVREVAQMTSAPVLLATVIEVTAQHVFDSFTDKMKQALNGRQDRALKMALDGHVTHKSNRIFNVLSEDRQHCYLVDLDRGFCTCPDSMKGNACKHRLAAYLIEQSMQAVQAVKAEPPAPKPEQGSSQPAPQPSGIDPTLPEENAIEKARKVLEARSQFLRDAIIYAKLPMDDGLLPVEIISIEGDVALVRALPKIQDSNLIPQFPFQEKQAAAAVIAKSLVEVRIYR